MNFMPYILGADGSQVAVTIAPMTQADAEATRREPLWQTDWTSDYIAASSFQTYAMRAGSEVVALAAYEILEAYLVVHIGYLEAAPASNPVLAGKNKKYQGIGRALVAFGIKLSIDNGFEGDVMLEAKTPELAYHYEQDFGAVQLPTFHGGAPRYLIADSAAKDIFFTYLK